MEKTRRNRRRGFLCLAAWLLVLCTVVTAVAVQPAEAASAQKVVTKKVSSSKFKKVSSSVKQTVIATAATSTYSAQLAGTEDEYGSVTPQTLLVTKNGKSYTKVKLESVVREKLGLSDSQYVFFYNLSCIDNAFYVTGAVFDNEAGVGSGTAIYVKTKNGSTVSVKKTSMDLNGSSYLLSLNWSLYSARGYYVAANDYMVAGYNAWYYISEDLKTWTKKKLTATLTKSSEFQENVWQVAAVSDKGLVLREATEYMWASDEEGEVNTSQYLYTTNFKTYKEVSTLNKVLTYSGTWLSGKVTTADIVTQQSTGRSFATAYVSNLTSSGSTSKSLKLLRSTGLNKYTTALTFSSKWNYFSWYETNSSSGKYSACTMYISTSSKNYVYISSSFSGTFKKYTTSLKAKYITAGVQDDDWTYQIYNGKYILMTKNYGKTVYKINTGKTGISGLFIAGNNLVLEIDGGYDYYIPLSTLAKAVK
ncbi:MAG: hypothetical protein LUE23_12535 [Lachnospiraceae bacterium]|nr:hypothetical protein [Lachnospiraceae bacterium]